MRLILIDNHTGYIWGDTADIGGRALSLQGSEEECAIEAARALDESFGEHGWTYEFSRIAPRDTGGGYHIYRADVRGSDAVTTITDGQDQEMIEAVRRDCEFIGYVACRRDDV